MRHSRRILASLLVVTTIASAALAAAVPVANGFIFLLLAKAFMGGMGEQMGQEVANHINKKAIEYVVRTGIFKGHPDGYFRPDASINRAELAKIAVEAVGAAQKPGESCFTDVKPEDWYAPYVCGAKAANIVSGYSDGTFRPSQTVNRAEALKILFEALPATEMAQQNGITAGSGGAWYAKYAAIAGAYGLTLFAEGADADLGKPMTRGDAAEVMYRTIAVTTSYGRLVNYMEAWKAKNYPAMFEHVSDSVKLNTTASAFADTMGKTSIGNYTITKVAFDTETSTISLAVGFKITAGTIRDFALNLPLTVTMNPATGEFKLPLVGVQRYIAPNKEMWTTVNTKYYSKYECSKNKFVLTDVLDTGYQTLVRVAFPSAILYGLGMSEESARGWAYGEEDCDAKMQEYQYDTITYRFDDDMGIYASDTRLARLVERYSDSYQSAILAFDALPSDQSRFKINYFSSNGCSSYMNFFHEGQEIAEPYYGVRGYCFPKFEFDF